MATVDIPDELLVDGKIGGKFKDVAAMLESLKAAQAKITEQGQKLGEVKPHLGMTPAGGDPDDKEVHGNSKAAVKAKLAHGLALLRAGDVRAKDVLGEFMDPSDLDYALDMEVASQKKYVDNVYEIAGGENAYKEILQWYAESDKISDHERKSFHREITSGDPTRAINAMTQGRQRYANSEGYDAKEFIVAVPGGAAKKVQGYANDEDMTRAFSDPRARVGEPTYDPAYRAEIVAKANITDLKGIATVDLKR